MVTARRRCRLAVLATVLLLATCALPAPAATSPPAAEATLREALAKLHAARTYSAELTVSIRDGARPPRVATGRLLAMKPNYLRVDLRGQGAVTTVCDGASLYTYVPGDHAWFRAPAPAHPDSLPGRWELEVDGFFAGPEALSGADVVAAGHGDAGGVPCAVVRVRLQDPKRTVIYAVGVADHLIHRTVIQTLSAAGATVTIANTLTAIRLNGPLGADRFAFTPPAGVQTQEPTKPDARLLTVGQAAPDFTLPALDGSTLDLAALLKDRKAAVVLFWSASTNASRAAIARLQALYRELGDKGPGVIAIDRGDTRDALSTLAQQASLTYPIAVGGPPGERANEVFDEYGVVTLPTAYVLDGAGKIQWRGPSFDEVSIRSALKALGIGGTD